MPSKFEYQRRTAEDVKTRANMKGGGFDTFIKAKYKMYKVRDGKNLIRILPRTWKLQPGQQNHYGYDLWVNYGIGIDNQSYLSLSKMLGKPDPVAEARRDAEREGDEKLARALQAKQRIGMWVIDRMAEDEGPQLWPAPFTVDKDFNILAMDEDTKDVIYIDDPETGCDIRFHKEGQGLLTKYPPAKMKIQSPSPLHEDLDLQDEWLDFVQANPIPDCLQFFDYEHIKQVFGGQARVERNDDEDEAPVRRRPAPREVADEEPPPRTRRTRPEPVAEEASPPQRRRAVAEPADDEAEEAPPPPRRTRPKLSNGDADDMDPDTGELTQAAPRPARGRAAVAPVDDETDVPDPPRGQAESIRERLQRRRGASKPAADEEPF